MSLKLVNVRDVICLFITIALAAGGWGATSHRVHVTVLRRTSTVHTSVSNRDEYLVRVMPKHGNAFVAKMIDEYPGYLDAAPFVSKNETASFSVALQRTPYCDGGLIEDVEEESMRCFAVVHGSWKIPKTQAKDEWWK